MLPAFLIVQTPADERAKVTVDAFPINDELLLLNLNVLPDTVNECEPASKLVGKLNPGPPMVMFPNTDVPAPYKLSVAFDLSKKVTCELSCVNVPFIRITI